MSTIEDRNREDQLEFNKHRLNSKSEPVVCKKFGCGKLLTLEEQRYGDRCKQHWDETKTDIMHVAKLE